VTEQVIAVAFDYGGVLTTPLAPSFAAWAEQDRIDPESLGAALKEWLSPDGPADNPVHRLETGTISNAEFGALLAAQLRTLDGTTVEPDGLLDRLFADLRLDPLMLELVGSLRAEGIATALLSNSWGNTYPMEVLEPLFDVVVISGEVGLRKPDAPIFHHTLDALGVDASRTAFVDDLRHNVDAATALGMHGILHVDAASTTDALNDLIRPSEEILHA
jgi:epoxide hydrolase-like predicted phosphatase